MPRMAELLSEMLAAIRVRLRPICAAMPQAEFDELTQRIAEIEYKYDRILALPASTFPPDVERRRLEGEPARQVRDMDRSGDKD